MIRIRKRTLLWILACLLVCFMAGSTLVAWWLTGPMRKPIGELPADLAPVAETVSFPATDGTRLAAWFLGNPKAKTAVILLHGHAATRQQMVARARFLHRAGFAVLLYDARAHGLSEGNHVTAGLQEVSDLLGAFEFLRSRGYRQFGCLGASQGGATLLLAAERLPSEVQWVIVESSYPTMRDALDRRFRLTCGLPLSIAGIIFKPVAEWRLHVSVDQIAPIAHIEALRCPVFVLGGELDRHTLESSTRQLFAAAHEPKALWVVTGAAHVDLYGFAKQEYEKRILGFISSVRTKE